MRCANSKRSRLLAAILGIGAAGLGGCRQTDPPPRAHRARGVLMFEPTALAVPDGAAPASIVELRRTFLANQIAILKSDRVVPGVARAIWGEAGGKDPARLQELRSAIAATSREPGLTLDVTVRLWAVPPSVRACDLVMEGLINYRREDQFDRVVSHLEWMNAQLVELSKDAPAHAATIAGLRREIEDLDRQRTRLAGSSDVRVLNRCVPIPEAATAAR
jgi:hypothetical protein